MQDSLLKIRNVSKMLGGKEILRDVSLELAKGELKVLIGPSGGGKSTLLQCVNLLLQPDQGEVYLDGNRVAYKKKKEVLAYRQKIGMIFQDFNLFDHLSALDNVSIALRKVRGFSKKLALERAMEELSQVGLADKADLYPAELSGGQKQRVSIARALAMDPEVLLLDEPTSALDPELIGEVLSVIMKLCQKGMTMLMATHQMSFVQGVAKEILFMEAGQIIEQGPPEGLLDISKGKISRTREFCVKLNVIHQEEGKGQ